MTLDRMIQLARQHLDVRLVCMLSHMETEYYVRKVCSAAAVMCSRLRDGGRLWAFGNGGSAAQASHFCAELAVRFQRERQHLPAIALTQDGATLTALVNDYDPRDLFRLQVEAHVQAGDFVLGITTSKSENVLRGLRAAEVIDGTFCCLLLGRQYRPSKSPVADVFLNVVPPGNRLAFSTAHIQTGHLLTLHMLADIVDAYAREQRKLG